MSVLTSEAKCCYRFFYATGNICKLKWKNIVRTGAAYIIYDKVFQPDECKNSQSVEQIQVIVGMIDCIKLIYLTVATL